MGKLFIVLLGLATSLEAFKRNSCNDLESKVNQYRNSVNLPSLACSDELRVLSTLHAYDYTDMKQETGQDFQPECNGHGWYRKEKQDCPEICCNSYILRYYHPFTDIRNNGEISTTARTNEAAVFDSWKNSAGHRENMEKQDADAIGCDGFADHKVCNFGPVAVEGWTYDDCCQ